MRVKFNDSVGGRNWSAAKGDIVDLPTDEALRFIASGGATEVVAVIPVIEGEVETADYARREAGVLAVNDTPDLSSATLQTPRGRRR